MKSVVVFDSDGCVMNAMEPKHRLCFGPAAVEIYNLREIEEVFLEKWNKVNLYASTRGTNRFLALVTVFEELESENYIMPDISSFKQWCKTTPALAQSELSKNIENDEILAMAFNWSRLVNEYTEKFSSEISPFKGALTGVKLAAQSNIVAVVTSAGQNQITDEWTRFGFDEFVSRYMCQEQGTKKQSLKALKQEYGDNILMVGDALGDYDAALENGLYFYPIIPQDEEKSWTDFSEIYLPMFNKSEYTNDNEKINKFISLLK